MSSTSNKPLILDTRSHTESPPSSFAESGRGNATWHTLLSAPGTATTSLTGGIAICPPTGTLALHRHKQAEVYYILDGSGEVEVEGERYKVSKDMLVWVPADAEHGVFCGEGEQLRWLYMFPEGSFEQIIYRFTHELKDLAGGLKAKL